MIALHTLCNVDMNHYTVSCLNVQQFLQNIELTTKPLIVNGFIALIVLA